jgi:hypothetical protein
MAGPTIIWAGASGERYVYWISPIDSSFKDEAANYIFAKETTPGRWTPIYIGETENLRERLSNHEKMWCIRRHGGTHVHAHVTAGGQSVRRKEEADLVAKWDPPCNQ